MAAGQGQQTFTPSPHTSVMRDEALRALDPREGDIFIDATLGAGGHAEAILERLGTTGFLLGLDRDETALDLARARLARFGHAFRAVHSPFSALADIVARELPNGCDGILFDFGVSSMQFDDPTRGFTFRATGPLDMRMNRGTGQTALELIASCDEATLARLLTDYGDLRDARRVARAILRAHAEGRLTTTGELATVVEAAVGHNRSHPAPTLVFQALRIAVNDELHEIETALDVFPGLLRPNGRACFISFHSLEDARVKARLRALCDAPPPPRGMHAWPVGQEPNPLFDLITRKALKPTDAEAAANPRARSARLRACRKKLTAPAPLKTAQPWGS